MKKKVKTLIISIGTGRSGSVSLSKFLSHQKSMYVLHEGRLKEKKIRKLFKWENDEINIFNWIEELKKYNNTNDFFGDTGMYYLPYAKKLINRYPHIKIIGLIRDKNEVVNSYLRKTKGRNHWYNHDGKEWKKDKKWDPCYPKFNEKNKKIALEKYWDDYHLKTKELQNLYPENLKMWKINEFNTEKGKNQILDFINYNLKRDVSNDFKLNQIKRKNIFEKIKEKWF